VFQSTRKARDRQRTLRLSVQRHATALFPGLSRLWGMPFRASALIAERRRPSRAILLFAPCSGTQMTRVNHLDNFRSGRYFWEVFSSDARQMPRGMG